MELVGVPSIDELGALTGVEREAALAEAERLRRRLETFLAEGVDAAQFMQQHVSDGHRTGAAWARATFNWSGPSARRVVRNGAALRALPHLREACRKGDVGVDQLNEFGRLWANPRVRCELERDHGLLVELAAGHWFDDFVLAVHRWEALADADGARRSHADAHAARRARLREVGDEVLLNAQCGTADGVLLREILDRFADAEYLADAEDARLGSGSDLGRTPAQRRFDALKAIFLTAAAGAPGVIGSDPLVNIVLDQATAEELLSELAGESVERPPASEFTRRRCETIDGDPLSHEAALAALLVGRMRGYIADRRGVVIHLGRTHRLFRGAAREAALLHGRRCLWPGCDCRGGRTQVDHSVPWREGGASNPANAGTLCGVHNRWKERGYRTVRRNGGRWDVYRPDGSLVGEHARMPAEASEPG